jgi:hypothetical protein
MRDSGNIIALAAQILHVLPDRRAGNLELLAYFLAGDVPVSLF